MEKIYILVELSRCASGEAEVHATPFASQEGVLKERAETMDSLTEEGYSVEWEIDHEVLLKDEEGNTWKISMEEELIRP